jgi:hypothetical protein
MIFRLMASPRSLVFRTLGSGLSREQSVFGVVRQAVVSIGDVQHHPLGLCVSHVFSNSPSLLGAISPMARTVDERQRHGTMLTISVDRTARIQRHVWTDQGPYFGSDEVACASIGFGSFACFSACK